ncbi:MAG: hypothetical protein M3067_09965 [Chloroflexota bacterium]|nr:hypothetical protein [Chloroflexota bacterium]
MADPSSPPPTTRALLEYVSSPDCSDCRAFEALIARVAPDYPALEVRAVSADSPRGIALSLGRGILRFPVIVLADKVLAIEAIAEPDLRAALVHEGVDRG